MGAGLITALKKQHPSIEFVGIGGPQMLKAGFNSLIPLEKLSVMGISGVIFRYFELRGILKNLLKEFTNRPPDLFIGIDYSYFNLLLAAPLKQQGIKTIQYVSPKIWAWRPKRVFKIKKAIDLVLTLFPFEKAFYDKYHVPATFVGHPLADYIDLSIDSASIKASLHYAPSDKIIAVLPGSRMGELKYMGPLFLEVMQTLQLTDPRLQFIVPMANPRLRETFETQLKTTGYRLNLQILNGQARQAMTAANLVIVKAGTATLEAMLLKRPMVVAYKCSALTYAIVAPQVRVAYSALPNLLANRAIVPEFIQHTAKAKCIAAKALTLLNENEGDIRETFNTIHHQLRQNANERAADAVLNLIN